MSTAAVIVAGVTAAAAVAGTAYTIMSSGSRSSGGQAQTQTQPVTMPDTPATVEPAAEEPVPEKETTAESLQAAPDAARGSAGTILTGGLGDTSETKVKKKTLLGS